MRRLAAPGLILLASVAAGPLTASAHPANVARALVTIQERRVDIALSANLLELDLVLKLDRDLDGRVDGRELEARRSDIGAYLRSKVSVTASGRELPMQLAALGIGRSGDGRAVVDAGLVFDSPAALGDLAIRCEPLTELGADHTTLARIDRDGASREFAFRPGLVYRDGSGTLSRALQFLKLGLVHIFVGYDHVAFLLGLLLIGGSALAIVKIVTAFTAAHSITLSLAALDLVALDPALVEAGIAVSIVYVAAENLCGWRLQARWLVSFAFGLVHGFGFAAVLKELALPPASLVASLVTFNLGVELAQVAIVVALVPALYWLGRTPLHVPLTRVASAGILCVGLFWLYQRVLS